MGKPGVTSLRRDISLNFALECTEKTPTAN